MCANHLDLETEAMNATSISTDDTINLDSDSDSHSDGVPEFYQPITATDDSENAELDPNDAIPEYRIYGNQILSNGHDFLAENGVRSLDLSELETDSEEEEEEEDLRVRSESAIAEAFQEDESRRNAPLTAENASRVREAMRGISFAGFAPDWAGVLPEEQLIDQIRRLRQSPHSAA